MHFWLAPMQRENGVQCAAIEALGKLKVEAAYQQILTIVEPVCLKLSESVLLRLEGIRKRKHCR